MIFYVAKTLQLIGFAHVTYALFVGLTEENAMGPELKLLMMGDYTLRQDSTPLEERKPININKDNFSDVMKSQKLELNVNVANKLSEKEGDDMAVKLKFSTLKDFEPEQVVRQVPELKSMLELREALAALKGPLGNFPAFKKKIQTMLGDEASRSKILGELQKKEGGEKK